MTELENQTTNNEQRTDYLWLLNCSLVTAIAVFLRFYWLDLKPMHHDEGVNGYFLTTLFREGIYKYDPTNYHGPDLYYFALAFSKIFGLNTISVRASVAIFGVLTVFLAFFLRKYIGKIGSIAAALFLALSPGMVYISRYFIHEIIFVFFTLGLVVSILYFIEGRKAGVFAIASMSLLLLICFSPSVVLVPNQIGIENPTVLLWIRIGFFLIEALLVFFVMRMLMDWNEGRPIYLLLASACAVMLCATKETVFITLGTMAIACVCVWLWRKIYGGVMGGLKENYLEKVELTWSNFRAALGNSTDLLLMIVAALAVFIYVGVLFFSSFFTQPEGVIDWFKAYAVWTKAGTKEHTQNGMWAYLKWGMKVESPVLVLSAIGTLIALLKARHRFAIFTGFWAIGMFAAYTLIPYKTPWLALSFILPMCIIAGYAVGEMLRARDIVVKILGGMIAIMATGILGYQSYDLNFVKYDDEDMVYVYAHTKRKFHDLIKEIEHYAEKSGKGKDATIEIVSPDYWSMPWYLNDYDHANFHGQFVDANTSEMIVIKKDEQDAEAITRYARHYKYAGTYPLRPGVDLRLLVRKDLADPTARDMFLMEGSEALTVAPDDSEVEEEPTDKP
jgi:uncharacterized protein (TIGR03663 family)